MNWITTDRKRKRLMSLRQAKPEVDLLEGRQLLTALAGTVSAQAAGQNYFGAKQIAYVTPTGGTARITLKGPGTLAGSYLDPDGALRLVYDETSPNTIILSSVTGGSRSAPIRSMDDADVAPTDYTGVNGNLINTVRLNNFDLVTGGAVNLTGGVGKLYLQSMAANSQLHLRDIPNATPVLNSIQLNSLTSSTSANSGRFDLFGIFPPIGSGNNNEPFTVASPYTSQGITRTYSTVNSGVFAGAVSLKSASGSFFQSTNIEGTLPAGYPPPLPGIPGVLLNIGQIIGGNPAVNPALISVQGNLQAIKAGGATGLLLQDLGDLGTIQIQKASDSQIFGYPIGHVKIAQRANVTIVSSARVVNGRAGVIVDPVTVPTGPISLPLS